MSLYYLKVKGVMLIKKMIGKSPYASRYNQLYDLIKKNNAKKILEIGTNNGMNASRMIEASNHKNQVEYYGFDLFENQDKLTFYSEFSLRTRSTKEVERFIKKKHAVQVILYAGDSTKTLPKYIQQLPKMDFIFIDGGHSFETVLSDWNNIQSLVKEDTIIVFDDYPNWGVGKVVDSIDKEQWDVEVLPVINRFKQSPEFRMDKNRLWYNFQLAKVTPKNSII